MAEEDELGSKILSLCVLVVCLVVVVIIGGCTREKAPPTPAPTSTARTAPPEHVPESSPTPSSTSTPDVPELTYYTVQAGDTVWDIADHFGISVQELVDANQLVEPDRLQPGQQLIIPVSGDEGGDERGSPQPSPDESGDVEEQRTHTVVAGDTLSSIATLYGTTAEEIATLNGLDPDDILAIGQRLVIP